MEKIVYFLGAGFSAPLGLPVMSNFIEKSKDLYERDSEEYKWFNEIYELIDEKLPKILKWFEADLNNIEEVLSILEMRRSIHNDISDDKFKKFIKDVIIAYTPRFKLQELNALRTIRELVSFMQNNTLIECYYYRLALSLLSTCFVKQGDFFAKANYIIRNRYTIITTNYDRVLELLFSRILNNRLFAIPDVPVQPAIIKLHGCVSTDIMTPNWNKTIDANSREQWDSACKALAECTQLRIVGYSLPASDAYIKYLFKFSHLNSLNLKNVDVITLDGDGARDRYMGFFKRRSKLRFADADVIDYLEGMGLRQVTASGHANLSAFDIEIPHNIFMASKAK